MYKVVKHMAGRIWANNCMSSSITVVGTALLFYAVFFGSQLAIVLLLGS